MYKIYEIRCNETDEVYIGKTIKTLEERLSRHKSSYNETTSKQIILRGDYIMSLIDECDTEEESIELEARYIRNTYNCINIIIPGRTKQEYYEENKNKIKETHKEYREENREIIIEKKKEYYYNNRDEILKKCKIYYENNIDHKKEYDKEYREKNKYEILEKKKEKYTCECGSTLTKDNKARHEKECKKHINFINSK